MKWLSFRHMTLLNRIMWFVVAFAATLVLQIGISRYQTKSVLNPLEQRMYSIQSISRFLSDVEGCMDAMENYRWDYGDTEAFLADIRDRLTESANHLDWIRCQIGQVSEEQYLLANAARTTYTTFSNSVDQILTQLEAGNVDRAAEIYYSRAEPCGNYLCQYSRELLEQAIRDNQSAYSALTRRNDQLKRLQSVVLLLCFCLGVLVITALMALLKSVVDMAQAARAISQGNLDTPDVDETLEDEIGDMAKAFNEMKRSMKQQVTLLEEKNEIERELFRKKNETLELQNLMEREKLQQLRSQINPHFLFNTLNVIMYTSQQEGAKKTHSLIGSLSRLFRYVLGSNDSQVPLAREIHIVDEFYALYRVRFGVKIRMNWNISTQIDLTETMVPSFILQPLVENAFRHGLGPKEEPGCVDITIGTEGAMLRITVADNGVGMSAEDLDRLRNALRNPPTTGEHIGVYNVAARLRLLGGECGLDIQSRQGTGTEAVLRLPLVVLTQEEEDPDGETVDRG